MTPYTIPQTVLFPDLFDKPLVATFNQEHASSDGGSGLLKAAERVYGLVKAFARCLADKRAPVNIRHTLADLIGQRVFGIACGHPDGNDADHLADDPIHKLLLCAAVLRPGKAVAADGTLGLLSRLLPLLRAAFPQARFLVRLDGGFATPEIFDFLDAEPRLDYVVAMAKNAVLQRHAESAMQVARAQSEVGGETAHVYTDTRYAAGTWDHERRVVIPRPHPSRTTTSRAPSRRNGRSRGPSPHRRQLGFRGCTTATATRQ